MNSRVVHEFYSRDGHLMKIRPLGPGQAHYLVDLFEHMGLESRFFRFNETLPDPDPQLIWAEATRLARVDPARDGGWLVFTDLPERGDTPVGGVRYMRIDADIAEVSMVVRDDMQNKGIGTEMARFLLQQARAAGVRTLVATVQRNNRAVMQLSRKVPVPVEIESEGSVSTLTADLTKIQAVS